MKRTWFVVLGLFGLVASLFSQKTQEQLDFLRSLNLTPKEEAWIAQEHQVRVHADYWPPYNYYDCQSQVASGITVSFLRWVGTQTGIQFTYPRTHLPLYYVLRELKQNQLDFSSSLHYTKERAAYLAYTNPVFFVKGGFFALQHACDKKRLSLDEPMRVTVEKASKTHDFLKEHYPHFILIPVPTEEEGLKLVFRKQADCHAGIVDVCNYIIQRQRAFSSMTLLTKIPQFAPAIYMAARKDWPELVSIVDKALLAMPSSVRNDIIDEYTHYIDWIQYKKDMQYAGIIIILLLLFVVGLLIYLVQKHKRVEIRLEKEKRRADEANQAKSDFIARISHEIRTPLTIIAGMLNGLQSSVLNNKQKQQVRKIDSANRLLVNLIQDLLDFSVLDRTRISLRNHSFNLTQSMLDLQEILHPMLVQKDLVMHLNVDPGVPDMLFGDEQKLKQVLINLITNAVKFTHTGSVHVSAKTLEQTDIPKKDKKQVRLSFKVADTGVGIPKEYLDQIFNPFFHHSDKELDPKPEGVGLGLAICKKIVSLWGGEINVSSSPGEGSCFWFTFFCQLDDQEYAASSAALDSLPQKTAYRRVLLAEDNLIIQEIVINMLSELGFKTDIASNGAEAYKALQVNAYDIVLMDINMPVEDGISVTKRIRQQREKQEIPIVALTAHSLMENKDACLAAGMNDFITKPFTIQALQALIVEWVPHIFFETRKSDRIKSDEIPETKTDITFIDISQLRNYLGNDVPTIQKHIESFQLLCNRRMSEYATLHEEDEGLEQFRSLTHNLKGESGFLGMVHFHAMCIEMLKQVDAHSLPTYTKKMYTALKMIHERKYGSADLC